MQVPAAMLEPLTEEQFARFHELAQQLGVESVAFIRGVFCAAATPANRLAPSDWLPMLLKVPPDSRETLVEFSRLCFTDFACCAELLDLEAPQLPELDDVQGVRDFCRGYMLLARSDERWFKAQPVFLATLPLAVLGELVPLDSLEPFFPEALTEPNWLDSIRQSLAERLLQIVRDFRAAFPFQTLPAQSDKIGRNEPCPCGSGRKYKKCCLLAN